MLKSLHLKDFQAHKRLSIELAPGITTIKGPSDVGKSAVLRALRWLCLNDISGDDFVRHGRKSALAKLRLADGHWIGRGKGKIGNVYVLDGQKLVAFGAGKVPEPVEQVLGVNEINFQRQHDQPFWLDESAPEVSRQLNRVVDLSVIDQAMANAAKAVRMARDRADVAENRLEEKRRARDELKLREPMVKAFAALRELHAKLEQARAERDALERIVGLIEKTDLDRMERRELLMGNAARAADAFFRAQKKRDTIQEWLDEIEYQSARAVRLPDFWPVESAWTQLVKAREKLGLLPHKIYLLEMAEDKFFENNAAAVEMRERLEQYACPTCGRMK